MSKSARGLPQVKAEEVGMSTERLSRIHPRLQKYIDAQKVPNIVSLVTREGRIVHADAQGYLDLESRQPVTLDTIYRLYSNSKPVAGVAIMLLYDFHT